MLSTLTADAGHRRGELLSHPGRKRLKKGDEFDAPTIKAAGYIPTAFGANVQQESWLFMALMAGVSAVVISIARSGRITREVGDKSMAMPGAHAEDLPQRGNSVRNRGCFGRGFGIQDS